jgi:hypothetical protein
MLSFSFLDVEVDEETEIGKKRRVYKRRKGVEGEVISSDYEL